MSSLVIAGAGGLAKQLLPEIIQLNYSKKAFYDSGVVDLRLTNYFPVLSNKNEIITWLAIEDPDPVFDFLIAIGKPAIRKEIYNKLIFQNGNCLGINKLSMCDLLFCEIDASAMLLHEVYVESFTKIGKATLVNVRAQIHHDVEIGDFCEIGPGAILLGGAKIGAETSVGAQATILPGVTLGSNVVVGAGAVVTKNFPESSIIAGNPAKIIS